MLIEQMDALDSALERIVRADHGDAIDDDEVEQGDDLFGLYYPIQYALKTWWNFKEYGILPTSEGWDAQDWRLVEEDWSVISARYNRMARILYPLDSQKGDRNQIRLPEPGTSADWMDLLK